jgi:hypothetical protein
VFLEDFIGSEFRRGSMKKRNREMGCQFVIGRNRGTRIEGSFAQSRPSVFLGGLSDPAIQAPGFLTSIDSWI